MRFEPMTSTILAPSWLVSSVGRALHWHCRGHGFKSCMGLNFSSGLIFTTSSVVFITVRIAFIFNIWDEVRVSVSSQM